MLYSYNRIALGLGSLLALSHLLSFDARAGRFEMSAGGNFGRSDYGDGSYNWSRRWGSSFGYRFSESSSLEVSYQDVVERTLINGYQDTTIHDRIYSLDCTQSLFGRGSLVDPYVKLGVAQLNRDATGIYAMGGSPAAQLDALSGLVGLGVRIRLTPALGLRGEVSSYLQGARISTWQNNTGATAGVSFYF